MWSSTSDNKKQEEIDDCSCSGSISNSNTAGVGSSSTAAAAAAALATPKQQQQQKLNTFDNTATTSGSSSSSSFSENNSNISIKPFGGNNSSDQQHKQKQELKEKEFDNAASLETGDSGFISGPQTHSCELDVDDFTTVAEKSGQSGQQGSAAGFGGAIRKTVNKQLLNIAAAEYEDEKTILDSGCIDEDLEEYDEEYGDEQEEKQKNREELQQEREQEQEHEATKQAASYLAGSAIATAAAATATATGTGTENQMILKQNVDAGMSEWFCNLSLQNTPATTTQQQQQLSMQQQQQQSVAGTAMNNLDSTSAVVAGTAGTAGSGIGIGRRSATIAGSMVNSQQQQQSRQHQQQQAAGNSATTTQQSTSATNLTPSNAWEQFYQQNDDGDTPLHLACISGYVDVVAALIRMAPHPCLFNIQNDEAQTPLHLAALTAQPKILRMLLIAGAEPTLRDRHGNTALHLVCVSGEEQCVRALTIPISASEINEGHRQYGHRSNDKTVSYLSCARLPSDFEIRNYDGERCVHLAAQAGHIDVLRILVLYGADINAREGKSGRTPLHIAIECCNEDLANFLLDECLKLNLETATYAGLTAYQVACIHEKTQMQNILEKRGAEPLTPPDSDYDSSDIESDLDDSKMYDRFGDPGYFISYNGGNPMTVA